MHASVRSSEQVAAELEQLLDAGALGAKLTTLSVAPLVADAIRCLHENGSLVRLLGEDED